MKTAAQQWDAALDANASDADREAILQRLNELLNRRSYIRNLVAGVEKELALEQAVNGTHRRHRSGNHKQSGRVHGCANRPAEVYPRPLRLNTVPFGR